MIKSALKAILRGKKHSAFTKNLKEIKEERGEPLEHEDTTNAVVVLLEKLLWEVGENIVQVVCRLLSLHSSELQGNSCRMIRSKTGRVIREGLQNKR